jgi:hypothetical protein
MTTRIYGIKRLPRLFKIRIENNSPGTIPPYLVPLMILQLKIDDGYRYSNTVAIFCPIYCNAIAMFSEVTG